MPSVSAGMRLSQTVDWSEESDENENDDPPNAPKKTIQKSSKTKLKVCICICITCTQTQ